MYYTMYLFINNGEYKGVQPNNKAQVNLFAQALEWLQYFIRSSGLLSPRASCFAVSS
jgi:hypothetical protein